MNLINFYNKNKRKTKKIKQTLRTKARTEPIVNKIMTRKA